MMSCMSWLVCLYLEALTKTQQLARSLARAHPILFVLTPIGGDRPFPHRTAAPGRSIHPPIRPSIRPPIRLPSAHRFTLPLPTLPRT
jgi:hypothetical protein